MEPRVDLPGRTRPRPPRALSTRLYIAARAPRLGLNKTRLAAAIGDRAALDLYRAFLADLAARLREEGLPIGWFVTPHDAWDEIVAVVGPGPRPEPVLIQPDGDWTERQRALLRGAPERGEPAVALIGSDSPQIDGADVARALRLLAHHDLVLGPVDDGGYYLIAMRGWHDVLAGVRMSVPGVGRRILRRAGAMGLSSAVVETTFDVDLVGDLPALADAALGRDDMPATRRALEQLGRSPLLA